MQGVSSVVAVVVREEGRSVIEAFVFIAVVFLAVYAVLSVAAFIQLMFVGGVDESGVSAIRCALTCGRMVDAVALPFIIAIAALCWPMVFFDG